MGSFPGSRSFDLPNFHHNSASTGSHQRRAATVPQSSSAGLPCSPLGGCLSPLISIPAADAEGERPLWGLLHPIPFPDSCLLVDDNSEQRVLPRICVLRSPVTKEVCVPSLVRISRSSFLCNSVSSISGHKLRLQGGAQGPLRPSSEGFQRIYWQPPGSVHSLRSSSLGFKTRGTLENFLSYSI